MRVDHVELRCQKLVRARERLNRASKVSIIYTWLVKTLHSVLSSFELSLVLFLPSMLLLYIDFVAFSFSMPPTVGCVQYSTPQNTYVVEDQPLCPTRPQLSRSAVLPCPPSLVHISASGILGSQCMWRMRVQIDIPECDRHVSTYVRTLRE